MNNYTDNFFGDDIGWKDLGSLQPVTLFVLRPDRQTDFRIKKRTYECLYAVILFSHIVLKKSFLLKAFCRHKFKQRNFFEAVYQSPD